MTCLALILATWTGVPVVVIYAPLRPPALVAPAPVQAPPPIPKEVRQWQA